MGTVGITGDSREEAGMSGSRAGASVRLMVLVAMAAQLVDLASFGMVARAAGSGGELGPLGGVYAEGGFGPVIAVKVLGLLAILCILALYRRRFGSPRSLALLVAAFGIVGAASNVLGILRLG